MRLTTRAALGWPPTQAARATPTKGLVIHYDGSVQGLDGKPHSACIDYWRRTRSFHMGAARGWADIGYSFGVCVHGEVFEGRGLGRVQAAQPGGNSTWYSATLMSGPGERPTPAQVDAVRQLRRWLMGQGVAGEVKGHRDFYSTSCPGDVLYALVKDGTFTRSPGGQKGDDMPTPKELWQHELPVPFGKPENPEWQAGNILVNIAKWELEQRDRLKTLEAKVDAQNATIGELARALATHDTEIDVEALVGRIEAAITGIKVRLAVDTAGEE
jgi:hypothetical protein